MTFELTDERREVLHRALEQFPQISGAGFGLKDDTEDEVVLKLNVSRKKAIPELMQHEILPETFMGYKVNVVQKNPTIPESCGNPNCKCEPKAAELGDTSGNLQDQFSYLAPGMSIGDSERTGTFACVLKNIHGDLFGLTNWHVAPDKGKPVFQPGPIDSRRFGYKPNLVGDVFLSTNEGLDVSAFRIKPGIQWRNTPVGQDYDVKPPVKPKIGEIYRKVGRTTGFTVAKAVTIGFIRMSYQTGYRNIYSVELRPLEVGNPGNVEVSMGGDSGALWVDPEGRAAMLHFAGDASNRPEDERGYGCPMVEVLAMLKMEIAVTQSIPSDHSSALNGIHSAARAALVALDAMQGMLNNVQTHIEAIRNTSKTS